MKKPQRAYEITVNIGGDTWDELAAQLRFVTDSVHSQMPDIANGGRFGYTMVSLRRDPSMTHDRYHAELRKYLAEEK